MKFDKLRLKFDKIMVTTLGCIAAMITLDSDRISIGFRVRTSGVGVHWVQGLGYSTDFNNDIIDDENCDGDKDEQ